MALRGWGIALLIAGILVIGTGIFAAVNARGMWQEADDHCAPDAPATCGAGGTLAASFLFLLGPLGAIVGILLMLGGAALFAIGRALDRALDEGRRVLATLLRP